MSTDPLDDEFGSRFSEFLADYFVESDEHLGIARRSLLALEQQLVQSRVDKGLIDELFRSFHSLKGLSAMVGFGEAEQLGHQLESFLGAVRRNQAQLTGPVVDALMTGVVAIEQVIAARRDAKPPPDVSQLLLRLEALMPIGSEAAAAHGNSPSAEMTEAIVDEKEALLAEKLRSGARAWKFIFTPSEVLSRRGMDVTSVRRKLQSFGEIISSVPVIDEAGRIKFSFIITSNSTEEEALSLTADGLTCVPHQLEPPVKDVRSPPASMRNESPSTHLTPANVVRVDLQRLDELMRLVGELVLSRSRLEDGLQQLDSLGTLPQVRALRETASTIERQLRDLREGVMRVRMVPIREVFVRMQFVIRDLIREAGKRVSLHLSGEDTQIDKYVVERIMDPLLHLVRNAVSHGVESPEVRQAHGKPPTGNIYLRAKTAGEMVVIEVEDDGHGIDRDTILREAGERGIAIPPSVADGASILDILCVAGFSTRVTVDRVSGRGIGMDVVRQTVEELGGTLGLQTTLGKQTCFEIQLPITVAITEALIVKVGDERYAIPQVAVREIVLVEPHEVTNLESSELLRYREGALPLIRLGRIFGIQESNASQNFALVIGDGVHAVGLAVDRVIGLREIVVRPLADHLVQVPEVSGATELGDGRVVLILDAANLVRMRQKHAGQRHAGPRRSGIQPADPLSL